MWHVVITEKDMAKRAEKRPELSDAEWAVMKVVWNSGPLAMGDIFAQLTKERPWAYTTARTLVRRMVAKGWISYQRVGNSFLYAPAVGKENALRSAVREFAGRVFDGLMSPFVAYLIEEKKLRRDDAAQLEEMLKEYRKKVNGGNDRR
jgi:BlaI family transcriptional regulator, penicillinase repressor